MGLSGRGALRILRLQFEPEQVEYIACCAKAELALASLEFYPHYGVTHMHLFKEDLIHMSISNIINAMLDQGLANSRSSRVCSGYSDKDMLNAGIRRVLGQHVSGRDFLQHLEESDVEKNIAKASYFDALKSSRREAMCTEVAAEWEFICRQVSNWASVDYLADLPELEGFKVLAVDGHHVSHACHDPRDKKGATASPCELFALNLRNGLMSPYTPVAWSGSRSHEIPALRQRLSLPPDDPEINVGDRAYVDNEFWVCAANSNSPRHLVTRTKVGMAPITCVEVDFDRNDPINTGVTRVRTVRFSNCSGMWHIVNYTDPETEKQYEFLTTLNLADGKIRPGTIVYLYKIRWRIEKVFDNFKNDLLETKAWASGKSALVIQASFTAMTYNLLRLIEALVKIRGLTDKKVEIKYKKALDIRKKVAETKGRTIHPFESIIPRMARISSQFIRTIRNHFPSPVAISGLLPTFKIKLRAYM